MFTDVSKETGILDHRGNGLGVVFGDYDDDGWVDAFVANDTTPNFLFHNEAGRRFSETALLSGVSVASDGMPRAGMGTDFGDFDGDSDLDLFVSNHELEAHTLFRNLGKGLFEDATFPSGVGPATLPYVGFGAAFVDYDNDTDLDLGIVNGHVMNSPGHVRPGATEAQRKLLLRNGGGGRLTEVGRQSGAGFASEKVGRTLVAGDIDNDGDLDLLVTNNGGNAELLRNEGGTGNNAVLIHLVGTKSNRSAAGARVRLTAGGTTQVREVKAGSSYLGQNDLRVHVGLGKATRIDRLEVRWPNGQNEVVEGARRESDPHGDRRQRHYRAHALRAEMSAETRRAGPEGPALPIPDSRLPDSYKDQKSNVTLKRANRGFSTAVGRSHVAPLVPKPWLNAVPTFELNRL